MIIKQIEEALKYCPTHDTNRYCDRCALDGIVGCRNELMMKAFDYIQELKKERADLIEELDNKYSYETVAPGGKVTGKLNVLEIVRRVAIEEFAEKLEETIFDYLGVKTIEEANDLSLIDSTLTYDVVTDKIDELLKEHEK